MKLIKRILLRLRKAVPKPQPHSLAYLEGFTAGLADCMPDANPYPWGSIEAGDWELGRQRGEQWKLEQF